MALIRFGVESQDLELEQDIYHWRVLQDAYIRIGNDSYRGVRVCLRHSTIVIMGLSQARFSEMNEKPRDYLYNNTVFSRQGDYEPGPCSKCRGTGKLDWVESATGVPFSSGERRRAREKRFTRDPDHILLYEKPKDRPNKPYFSTMGTIFSRTMLEPGETRCKWCHGVGLTLDGRLQMFPNMPALRRRLTLVRTSHWKAVVRGRLK